MSCFGACTALMSTDLIDISDAKKKRNLTLFKGAIVFDIIYILGMILLGLAAARGKIFSQAIQKNATITFFTLAAANFILNAILLVIGYIKIKKNLVKSSDKE